MVEAAGVEPASEDPVSKDSTCMSALDNFASGVEGRLKPSVAKRRKISSSRVGATLDDQPTV